MTGHRDAVVSQRQLCALALVLALGCIASSSRAQTAEVLAQPASPIAVQLEVDLPVALAAGLLGGSMQLLREELVSGRCAPHCDGTAVNALDATTVGRYSRLAADAGNGLVAVNLSLPLLLGAIGVGSGGASWDSYGEDVLVMSQMLAINVAIHQMTAFATQRPRPYSYNPTVDPELLHSANTYLSFYSGHTANAFAAASAYGYLFSLRHPNSRWSGGVWALGYGLAGLQGYLRVASGYHYWTDVLVGAAMGTGVGLFVPWLHTVAPVDSARADSARADSARADSARADSGGSGQREGWTVMPWAQSRALGVQLRAWR